VKYYNASLQQSRVNWTPSTIPLVTTRLTTPLYEIPFSARLRAFTLISLPSTDHSTPVTLAFFALFKYPTVKETLYRAVHFAAGRNEYRSYTSVTEERKGNSRIVDNQTSD